MIQGQLLAVFTESKKERIKVACVGDSITEGYRSSNPDTKSYPAVLASLVGERYDIENYGIGGSTVMRAGDMSYFEKWGYEKSLADTPDVVLFMMGTNDCNRDYNIRRLGGFYADYVSYINDYRRIGASTVVLTSPELFCNVNNANIRKAVEWQKTAASIYGCDIIDVNAFSHNNNGYFPDNVHCDDSGYTALAYFIYNRAFGGDLYEVTVHTAPRATVTVGTLKKKANGDGVVVFAVPKGEYKCAAFLTGCRGSRTQICVADDTEITLTLEDGGKELAFGKPVTASTIDGGNLPKYAVDGRDNTRYASASRDGQWLVVDLGDVYTITGAQVSWEAAYATEYSFDLSTDGEHFENVASVFDGSGGEVETEITGDRKGRYFRINLISRGTFYGFSFWHLKVFGE